MAIALDPVTQYARDVLDGREPAGKWVRLACERHLRDLDRQGTEGFPWVFNPEPENPDELPKMEKALAFFSFCHHVKGPLAGQPIDPAPFMRFIIGAVFGWVHRDTGLRRFRKAYVQVASGNAKSTLLAVISLYMLMADGEASAEVYATATKADQAKIVFDLARVMAERSPDLLRRLEPGRARIDHRASSSEMRPLSKDTKSLDGLNPHLGIIDEYHAHPSSDMYDILVAKMVKRLQPLLAIITTAGFDLSGPCYAEYTYCCKVLEGALENDRYFAYIAQLDKDDSPKDESTWIKANPLVATTEHGMAELRSQLAEALDDPRKMRNFLTKNMNQWVDQKPDGYMAMDRWKACAVSADQFPDLKHRECWIGVDLSSKIDLASVGFEFRLDDGRLVVLSHSFMPEERLAARRKEDKVPFDLWVKQGYITAIPGAVVDHDALIDHIEEQVSAHGWIPREVCVDPWSATQFSKDMLLKGYTVVEIPQRLSFLSESTKDFREQVLKRRLIHTGNPVLTWAMSNAVTKQDHNQNIMLDKQKATERIDPVAALMNAHARAIHNEQPEKSVYETRGPIRL